MNSYNLSSPQGKGTLLKYPAVSLPPPTIPTHLLLTTAALGLLICVFLFRDAEQSGKQRRICTVRAAWSVSVISLLFLLFQEAGDFAAWALSLVSPTAPFVQDRSGLFWKTLYQIAHALRFQGENYTFFRVYLVFPLYLYFLIGNFFVLYFLIRPTPETDKYWQLMKVCVTGLSGARQNINWSLAKTGLLALLVKSFFLPLLTSWAINNAIYGYELVTSFELSAFHLHRLLLHLIISLDVAIFFFGYLTELPQLKNTIRSVEPTLLGWVACLMCYPPFNSFAFLPFDHQVLDDPLVVPTVIQQIALIPILLLWGFYTWASVALGWKASNLTNRGIVTSGPYRYLRHPAYTSKVLIWCIESVILGKYYLTLCITYALVYALRAWTEERHLSSDPDYAAYKDTVRGRFLPSFKA